ncbi:hypothetical protein DITRI_Ditri11bG0091000 [Diplodiscus trichospermus]
MEESEENNKDVDVAPTLIAVHPNQNSVAVVVGPDLRVFNLMEIKYFLKLGIGREDCAMTLVDESGGASHNDSIRALLKMEQMESSLCWR